MKPDDCNCKMGNDNLAPFSNNIGTYSNFSNCIMPVRRLLEPVLVARIYEQTIVEEIPYSSMSMSLDNTTTISNACMEIKPICDCGCDDGSMYRY